MGNPRKTNGHRRRTIRAHHMAHPHPICGICGQPIDKTLHYLDPGALEVDEIVPVSRGGSPYTRANTQPAHRSCNQAKGNRMPGDPAITRTAPQQPTTALDW